MPAAYAEARRTEILEAALAVFVRDGVTGATMQGIAQQADLSVGALYRYFENKEALVQGVMQVCHAESQAFFQRVDEHAAGGGPRDQIRSSGRLAWDMFGEPDARDQAIMALESTLAAARDGDDPIVDFARQGPRNIIDGLTELVWAAQEAGELDPDLSARHLASLLYACHLGTRDLVVLFGDDSDAEGILHTLLAIVERLAPKGS